MNKSRINMIELMAQGYWNVNKLPLIIHDTFTDSNGVTLPNHTIGPLNKPGNSWVAVENNWDIQSNTARPDTADVACICTVDSVVANVMVTVTLRWLVYGAVGGINEGIILRATDDQNLWLCSVERNTPRILIYERVTGNWTERASTAVAAYSTGVDYTIQATCNADTISLTLDGANKISYTSASFNNTVTTHGLRSYWQTIGATSQTQYTNFMVNRIL
jgi:hypothetical protein